MSLSPIQAFYCGRSVFVTGATGFCGQALLHKLLGCPKIGSIYLLLRDTTAGSTAQRLDQLLDTPLLADVSRTCTTNIVPVKGDISQEGLGLSPDDRRLLCQEVSVVFHAAATVRFTEPLINALNLNVGGTRRVLDLCHEMEQLKSLVYVSTAYSNCHRSDIDERVYPPPVDPLTLDKIYKKEVADIDVLGNWPNTYSLSKAMAENEIRSHGADLPVAIVRPSVVCGSCEGPIPGWIAAGGAGPNKMHQPISTGQQGFVLGRRDKVADIVPVDMTANILIAAAWDSATQKQARPGLTVYNYVSGPRNPVTWGEYFDYLRDAVLESPPSDARRPYRLRLVTNRSLYRALTFLTEMLPAHVKDAMTFNTGNHKHVKKQSRIINYADVIGYFMIRQWTFCNDSVQSLLSRLTEEDKKKFNFDVATVNWRQYMKDCYRGTRQFMNQDPPNTIPQAKKHYRRLQVFHWMTQSGVLAMSLALCTWGVGYM